MSAIAQYKEEVEQQQFPSLENSRSMTAEELEKLQKWLLSQ